MQTVLQVLEGVVSGYCLYKVTLTNTAELADDIFYQWVHFSSGKRVPGGYEAIRMLKNIRSLTPDERKLLLYQVETCLNFHFFLLRVQAAGATHLRDHLNAGLVVREIPTEQELRDLCELLTCTSEDRWDALLDSPCLVEV